MAKKIGEKINMRGDEILSIESIDQDSGLCILSFERDGEKYICRDVPIDQLKKPLVS